METVVQPPADAELNLLTDWGDAGAGSRTRKAAALSILAHITAIAALAVLPASLLSPPPQRAAFQQVTPLIEPLTELTQKAPNQGKVSKEFDSLEARARPRIQIPAVPASAPRPPAPRVEAPPVPKPAPPLPEPPKVDTTRKMPPKIDLPGPVGTLPPQIQPEEPPKLALENVGRQPPPLPPDQRRVAVPNPSVSDAIRHAIPGVNDPGSQAHSGTGVGA